MELKAKFKEQKEIVTRSNFKSRKVWVTTTDGKYEQTIEIEVNQDKVDLFNGVAPGTDCTLHLNLRGRLWTGTDGVEKCFNSIVCWKVDAERVQVAKDDLITPPTGMVDDLPF